MVIRVVWGPEALFSVFSATNSPEVFQTVILALPGALMT
jgi:hypothetical protein